MTKEEENIAIVTEYGWAIEYIKNPSEAVKKASNKQIFGMKVPDEESQLAAVTQNGSAIRYIENPSEKVQLAAVTENGAAIIIYISNPSEAVQLAAVKQNGSAIEYISNPSEKVQLAAVTQDGYAIEYISNPSEAIKKASMIQIFGMEVPNEQSQLAAVTKSGIAIKFISNPSEAVQLAAVTQNSSVIEYIKNPSEKVKRCAKNSGAFWKEEESGFCVSKASIKETANYLEAENEKELQEHIARKLKNLFPDQKIVMEYILTHLDYKGSQRADIVIFRNDLPFVIIEVKQGLQFDKKYAKSDATKQLKNYLHLSNAVFRAVLSQGYCEMWRYCGESKTYEEIDEIDWSAQNNMEIIDAVAKAKKEQSKVEQELEKVRLKHEKLEEEIEQKEERLKQRIRDLAEKERQAQQNYETAHKQEMDKKSEINQRKAIEREEKRKENLIVACTGGFLIRALTSF